MFAGSKSRHLDRDMTVPRADIGPDNDHTDTPATMAIDALFYLSFLLAVEVDRGAVRELHAIGEAHGGKR